MADPRRYYIDPTLNLVENKAELEIIAAASGDWIKWADFEDYKSAQRRNKSEETVTRLGVEVAQLRVDNATLQAKVAWLMKADRLVCWDGKAWVVRHNIPQEGRTGEPKP